MLQSLSKLHHRNTQQIKQVTALFSLLSLQQHHPFSTSLNDPQSHSTRSQSTVESSIHIPGISKSVISSCSRYWDKKIDSFTKPSSLKDYLVSLSNFSPKIIRRFWGVSELKPENVLELLLCFEFNTGKFETVVEMVESLWGIFNWATRQSREFKHLPQSWNVMVSMVVRVGLVSHVEFLLSAMENEGIMLDDHEIFGNIIELYVGACELEMAVATYDQMRSFRLVPPVSCYRALLDYLVQMSETTLVVRVYRDMLDMGLGMGTAEKGMFENVIQLLCRVGTVQEARNFVKKVLTFGMEPTNLVLNAVASGYCEKKDYDDLLSFFTEVKCPPDVMAGNKIIFSLCRDFGAEEAFLFMQDLGHLGYCPDEITFGILIGWSCREGKLKNAFIYMSEILTRGLKPHIYSYNALLCGVFKKGMWKHARDILHEMDDCGITSDMSTFRVLLAGYCRARQFDEAKEMIVDMVERGLIQLAEVEDPLSKAFILLGLDPLDVKVKRDNDVRFSKTEFYDNMGNGLYLEMDVVKYEKTMNRVLDDSMILKYNSLVLKYGGLKNFRTAMLIIDELVHWGQELSLSDFSMLLKGFHASSFSINAITKMLKKMPKLHNELDEETLNLLVHAYIKKGFTHKAKMVFDGMIKRSQQVNNETYTALIASLCKKGNLKDLHNCWEHVQHSNWLPGMEDYEILVGCFCQKEMLEEALGLFEKVLLAYPHNALETYHTVLEKLCENGFTRIAYVLVEELLVRSCVLDSITYSHLVRGFYKEKHFSEAFVVTNTMLDKNMVPEFDVCVSLIPLLCGRGYFDQAIRLKEIASRLEPSLSIDCALIRGYCNKGVVGIASSLLQEMLSKVNSLNTEVFNVLIQGYCRIKDFQKVGELLVVMIRKNISISISSYQKLVSFMCTEGRIHFAFSLKSLLDKDKNPSNLIVYNILIFNLLSSGYNVLVDPLLDEIQESELQFDAVTYSFLVYGFSQCKAVSRSLQYLTAMMAKELRPSNRCLRAVISSLCFNGELGKALKLSQEMESRGWVHCSSVQNCIVQDLLNNGGVQEAVNFLDRMLEKGLIPDNIIYDNLIKQLCSYGRHEKAVDLLDIMLTKGNIPNSTTYDYIIKGLCTCGKLEETLGFHYEMLGRNLRPSISTWDVLINKFCEVGKTAEAEMLLNTMVQLGEIPSRKMFSLVVSRYRLENNNTKASEILRVMQRYGYEPDFETHWSLINNLSKSSDNDKSNKGRSFLSTLLSKSGFGWRKDDKVKPG